MRLCTQRMTYPCSCSRWTLLAKWQAEESLRKNFTLAWKLVSSEMRVVCHLSSCYEKAVGCGRGTSCKAIGCRPSNGHLTANHRPRRCIKTAKLCSIITGMWNTHISTRDRGKARHASLATDWCTCCYGKLTPSFQSLFFYNVWEPLFNDKAHKYSVWSWIDSP
jgi:hypothetical protein